MKIKKTIYALLSGLLLSAALVGSPVFADTVKSGLEMNEGPYTIFNVDPERSS